MFSNDQNIERIASFIEEAKRWFELKTQCTRLTLVEKTVSIISALILFLVFGLFATLTLIFLAIAAAVALSHVLNSYVLAFAIVGGAFFLLLVGIIMMRRVLIERPLVCFLVSILADGIADEPQDSNKTV